MYKLDEKNNFVKTQCGHTFHFVCLIKAMQYNKVCPYCRSFLSENEDEMYKLRGQVNLLLHRHNFDRQIINDLSFKNEQLRALLNSIGIYSF